MTFAEFSANRRRAVFPEGEAEELVANHKTYVVDALIDLQNKIKCIRKKHYELIPACATFWNCGASVFDAPRGFIFDLRTVLASDQCSVVRRFPLTRDELRCKMLDYKDCGSYKVPALSYDQAGSTYYYPTLPLGMLYEDPITDQVVRPTRGWFTLYDDQIWTFPALQSNEVAILEWEGIKRSWLDDDLVSFDREIERTVELYLEAETRRRDDSDMQAASAAIASYNVKVGDLIHNCRKEMALPQIEPCFSNCDGCGCATSASKFWRGVPIVTDGCRPSDFASQGKHTLVGIIEEGTPEVWITTQDNEVIRTEDQPPTPPSVFALPVWPNPTPYSCSGATTSDVISVQDPVTLETLPVGAAPGVLDPITYLAAYPGALEGWAHDVWDQFIGLGIPFSAARLVWAEVHTTGYGFMALQVYPDQIGGYGHVIDLDTKLVIEYCPA